ncbi:aldose 1-epimerase family protein [Bosea sp. PAMC 26642]|uniref:aldose 1-epimerase family protein n=1 Tax=Bosea sp. (strain PAMC 26642) TaxID=1792307 RepID=UPI00076FFBA1|nr:aldose 1-epimerase family protein [Bosea sp. PAMC 26642]AMJ63823.1 aldose epimerase [Bosea sp. PAMC 26642]
MSDLQDRHSIAAAGLAATISSEGAELVSLKSADGTEWLWQAGPQWPRHAPVLFPIVGRLADDTLRHQGRDHRLTQHGFARDSRFGWVARGESSAHLRLSDSAATRALYPFAFTLDLIYAAAGNTLSVTAVIANPGDQMLPCSLGAHPAFNWPLVPGLPQESHAVEFSDAETGTASTLTQGLLDGTTRLPLEGRALPLSPALFEADALILSGVASRSIRYMAHGPDGQTLRALTVAWEGYRDLGLWSKPGGAPFLCIEPWYGTASPLGWQGEFADKPGLMHIAPGETRTLVWSVTLES